MRFARDSLVTLAYLSITLVLTYPLVFNFSGYFIGGPVDGSLSVWSLWWMRYALTTLGQNFLDCQYLFFPSGVNLTFHTIPKLLGTIFVPLNSIFSVAASYNLLVVLTFVGSALAVYWIVLNRLGQMLPAFVAGAFFAFTAYRMGQLSHINLLPTMLIPVYIALLMKGKKALGGSRGWGYIYFGLAGLVLALVAYDTEHYAIFLSVLTVLYLVFYVPLRGGRSEWMRWLHLFTGLLLTAITAIVIFSPMLWAAAQQISQEGDFVRVPLESLKNYSSDGLSFFIPTEGSSMLWSHLKFLPATFRMRETSFLGLVIMTLGIVGAWRYRNNREIRFWILAALVFAILSLGPVLHIMRRDTGLPMPYLLINYLPGLNTIRTPSRYVVITTLALAILAGYGTAFIFERLKRLRHANISIPVAAGLIMLVFLLETKPNILMVSLDVPPVYQEIASSELPEP